MQPSFVLQFPFTAFHSFISFSYKITIHVVSKSPISILKLNEKEMQIRCLLEKINEKKGKKEKEKIKCKIYIMTDKFHYCLSLFTMSMIGISQAYPKALI